MYDRIEKVGNCLIQHGKLNDRIYLMKALECKTDSVIPILDKMAVQNGYSKIFAKVPSYAKDKFENEEYITEAVVPKFYKFREDVFFMSKYFSRQRQIIKKPADILSILELCKRKAGDPVIKNIDDKYTISICSKEDSFEMSGVYKRVFETYPFPIHDPDYIAKTMDEHIIYFCIKENDRIIALSSCETDPENDNVEMTDFATLPEFRGMGFSQILLFRMEDEMIKRGFKTSYTIARAVSAGMNVAFSKMGYTFCGTLRNNTNISGSFESMNVWYKFL